MVNIQLLGKIIYLLKEEESLVEVVIDKYPIAQYSAEGHVLRALPLDQGVQGDLDIIKTNL